jgi:predicted O-methyltransferase YrrM
MRLLLLRKARERSRDEATRWANGLAISTDEAITALCGSKTTNFLMEPILIQEATTRVTDCAADLGGPADIRLLYALTRHLRPDLIVETGVAYGWSSLAILAAIEENGSGKLVSIDRPDMTLPDDRYIGCAVPDRFRHRWTLRLGVDRDRLPAALAEAEKVKLVHYDSDKSYLGRAWAYRKIWPAIAHHGVFVSDDISDNTAFRDFCREVGVAPIIIRDGSKFCGIALKR